MRVSSALAAAVTLVLATDAAAQQAPAATPAEDLQQKCYDGRTELQKIYSTLTDTTKQGIIAKALEEIMEIEEDSDWRACLHEIETTLAAVK
jgi:hypothetical protein